ncbi:unnamed protein product [Adineta steineri]|uniref:Uncharacterized protein n=1 Tax=Adineta steineri TaxID=433720 RepID=A0A814CTV9_9BILA|nr:unnamed protein product [Adineta steineri]
MDWKVERLYVGNVDYENCSWQSCRSNMLCIIQEVKSGQHELNKYNEAPFIGREQEITSCISILSRPTKNNPLLIGESGVGKTSVIKELSERTISENVFPLHTKSTIIHGTASLTSYIEKYITIASNSHIAIYVDANGQYQLQVRAS